MATLERILTELMLRRRRDVAFDLTLRLPQERYAKNIRKEVIEFKCAFEQQQNFASSLRLKMKQQTNKTGVSPPIFIRSTRYKKVVFIKHTLSFKFQLNPERDTLLSKIPMSFKMIIQDSIYLYLGCKENVYKQF